MVKLAGVAQMAVRILGVVLIVLGLILWTGRADQLKDLHKLFGILIVIAIWALAYVAVRSGVSVRIVGLAVVWSLIAPVLGLTQENLLTGGWHWIIQVIHLLIGLGLIGWGERLGQAIKAAPAPTTAPG